MSITTVDLLLRKLDSVFDLDDDDRTAVSRLPMQVSEIRADQDLVREGDRPSRSCFLLSGFACWFKITGDAKRQITSFLVPGDMPDLMSIHLETLDSTLATISPCKVAFVQHEELRKLCIKHPRVANAFWRMTLIDAAIFREWVANVGGRQAASRMAHLICELVIRLRVVGLADGDEIDMPITQGELAEATGLSTVHANRVIKTLRQRSFITWEGTRLQVLDWPGLAGFGDFDLTYLHSSKRRLTLTRADGRLRASASGLEAARFRVTRARGWFSSSRQSGSAAGPRNGPSASQLPSFGTQLKNAIVSFRLTFGLAGSLKSMANPRVLAVRSDPCRR